MKTEELILILVAFGFFLMIPVVDWMVRVVGEKLHLFKKVYLHKGKRCGTEQVEVPFGDLFIWTSVQLIGIWLVFFGLVWLVEQFLKVELMVYVGLPALICAVGSFSFSAQKIHRACLFCSERQDEVEAYIEKKCQKNQYYRFMVTDIQYEDGLYMIFRAEPEEYRKNMEAHVKTYTRECVDPWKILLSKRFYWLVACLSLVIAMVVFWGGTWFMSGIDPDSVETLEKYIGDIPALLAGLFVFGPVFALLTWKKIFAEKAVDKLRVEEGLSLEKYEVRCSLEKVDEGRLVFWVRERRLGEQDGMKRKDPL